MAARPHPLNETLKIVLPMAGLGKRLRPLTWSRPKQLLTLADNTVLGHLLEMFTRLPAGLPYELVFIVGYLGDKIEAYMASEYPQLKTHFVQQAEMKGQSHAIHQARRLLTGGPMLMVFADTLVESDLGFLAKEPADAVAWVKEVPDPRRFGVAEAGSDGWVRRLIEKPESVDNRQAVVGFYYFSDSARLIAAIEEQMRLGIMLNGEYFLVDAINLLLKQGLKMRLEPVEIWLDAGVPETMLAANRYLLDHGHDNSAEAAKRPGAAIVAPVFIHPEAQVSASVIGPHVSIGRGCRIERSIIADSIIEAGTSLQDVGISASLIGENTAVRGRPIIINLGDNGAAEL